MSGSSGGRGRGLGIAIAVIVLLVGAFFLFAPYYSTHLWWMFRSMWFWFIPLVVLVVLALVGVVARDSNKTLGVGLWLLTAAGVVAFVPWLIGYNYTQDAEYAQSVRVTDDPAPAFNTRAPFTVSSAQVQSNLGAVSGDTQPTMYVAKDETFSTLVEQRGWTTGYQTLLEQKIGSTGRNIPTTCNFTAQAGARLGGILSGNLGRVINSEQRWVSWTDSDAYGWCDEQGTPFVVVPLVEQEGVFIVTEKPAGVALYNGKTGAIDIRLDAAGIPGPTYPLSLAETQRGSTVALGGFWAYVWGSAGWELPDEADSINSSNQSEFVLSGKDGGEFYVTPESGRGAATAISVLTTMDAELKGNELAPVTVHRLNPVWSSATAITDRVRAEFGDVLAKNPGADITELVPTSGGDFVVTIGRPQNMLYRVTGAGALPPDVPLCLFDLTGTQLRCGGAGGIGVATGGTGPASGVAPVSADSDLSQLSPEQLADLLKRSADELARRAAPVPAVGGS